MTMNLSIPKLFFSTMLVFRVAEAFVLKPAFQSKSVIGKPLFYVHDDNEHSEESLTRNNKARTDVRNFLTQRSIQSFVFLLGQVRDEHTARWMEKNLGFGNLADFHGTGAFNMTLFPSWDSLFLDLVMRPSEIVILEVKQKRRRHRGLSGFGTNNYLETLGKNQKPQEETPQTENPYVEEVTVEYEFDIDPPSLVNRIIAVREQISEEWMSDLETLIKSNDELLDAYLDEQYKTRASEENSEEEDQEDEEEIQDLLLAHGEDDEDAEDDVTEDNKGALAQDDEDEIDLEIKDLLAPFSDREGDMQRIAYDRSAMTLLTNSFANQDRDSSPFRMANFDLLLLLSTQESIHRVLKDQKEENDIADYEWLRDFYTERVKDHFDGHQTYGRAEDFLVDLLKTPPIIQESGNGEFHIIDPMGMAEDIIRERSEVAKEWKDLVAEAPSEHTDLRRLLLVRRMNDATEKTLADSSPIEIEEKASSDYEVGAFE